VKKEENQIRQNILNLAKDYFQATNDTSFIPLVSKVPVSGKVLDEEDLISLLESSLDMWLTSGDFTDNFEKKLREVTGIRHALFVNSGSSANLLAVSALKVFYNLSEGDEVITSAVNFPTTLNPIIQNNLKPVFVDAKYDSLNIDVNKIEESITEKTKGIVLAHTLGNPFDLEKIKKICENYKLFLMEDMCDALGSEYGDKKVGQFGDVSTLSFYPAHHITTGEGGAVLTNNTKIKKIVESLRDWGRDCYCPPGVEDTCKKRYDWQLGGLPHGYDHKYIYSHIGYNLKATDMQAAIGLSQLKKLDNFIKIRRENYEYLRNAFDKFQEFDFINIDKKSKPSWFGFPVTINEKAKFTRTELLLNYEQNRIGTRLLFAGNVLLQPAYFNKGFGNPSDYPVANKIVDNTFWLGVYPGLTEEHLKFVVETTDNFISQYS